MLFHESTIVVIGILWSRSYTASQFPVRTNCGTSFIEVLRTALYLRPDSPSTTLLSSFITDSLSPKFMCSPYRFFVSAGSTKLRLIYLRTQQSIAI